MPCIHRIAWLGLLCSGFVVGQPVTLCLHDDVCGFIERTVLLLNSQNARQSKAHREHHSMLPGWDQSDQHERVRMQVS